MSQAHKSKIGLLVSFKLGRFFSKRYLNGIETKRNGTVNGTVMKFSAYRSTVHIPFNFIGSEKKPFVFRLNGNERYMNDIYRSYTVYAVVQPFIYR